MTTTIITDVQPEDEPITLAEAYHQLRIDEDPEEVNSYDGEALVRLQMVAARQSCESYAGVSFGYKILKTTLSSFPKDRYGRLCGEIELPFGPSISVESFTYGADEVPVEDYFYIKERNILIPHLTWPMINSGDNPRVDIVYATGYGNNSDTTPCPAHAKIAILLTLGHLDANREDVTTKQTYQIPNGAKIQLDLLRDRLGGV